MLIFFFTDTPSIKALTLQTHSSLWFETRKCSPILRNCIPTGKLPTDTELCI